MCSMMVEFATYAHMYIIFSSPRFQETVGDSGSANKAVIFFQKMNSKIIHPMSRIPVPEVPQENHKRGLIKVRENTAVVKVVVVSDTGPVMDREEAPNSNFLHRVLFILT